MPITNVDVWNGFVEVNQDPYSKCCVDVARGVMEALDKQEEFGAHDLICSVPGATGITGFMAAAVAKMVWTCHSRGDEFRKSWNTSWGVESEDKIVNPALMTIQL